jgi:hypothetical protein
VSRKKGFHLTEEHRRKIGEAHKGRIFSEETKRKMSIAKKGKPSNRKGIPHSEETKKKLSELKRGKLHTQEQKDKIRQSVKKKFESPEIRKRMSESHKGKKNSFYGKCHTKEALQKMRDVNTGENNHGWKGGKSFFPYCMKFDRHRKRAVRKFFGYCCIICGKHTNENIIKSKRYGSRITNLHVHHIDHNKDQGCNGIPFNLVPLCSQCHSIEKFKEKEFSTYITNILESGFEWGIWSREQYEKEVMYNEPKPN